MDHKANFFCLAVLKECPPFQSSWSVLNLPFMDWQNFVLKSLVPSFLPFSRSLEGGQIFFHPLFSHSSPFREVSSRDISFFEPKQALTQSLKEKAMWMLRNQWINKCTNKCSRFREQRLIPSLLLTQSVTLTMFLDSLYKKGMSHLTFKAPLCSAILYQLMIHRRTLEGKSQWDGPPHHGLMNSLWWQAPFFTSQPHLRPIFSSSRSQLPGHLLTWCLWLRSVPVSPLTLPRCRDGKT